MKNIYITLLLCLGGFINLNAQCMMVCNNNVNISLDSNGEAIVIPDMVMEGDISACTIDIGLFDAVNGNQILPFDTQLNLNCSLIGNYVFEVREVGSGNSCWGNLIIEDLGNFCDFNYGADTLVVRYYGRTQFGNLSTDTELNGSAIEEVYDFLDIIPKSDLIAGENTLSFPATSNQNPLAGVSTLDIVYAMRIIAEIEPLEYPLQAVLFDNDDSGYLGTNDLFVARQLVLGIIPEFPAQNFLFMSRNFEFAADFDPFDFTDLNFREYKFQDSDVTNEDLGFFVYKIGDISSVTDSIGGAAVDSRSVKTLNLQSQEVTAGETYFIPFSLDGEGQNIMGGQISFDLDGLEFMDFDHAYTGSDFLFNALSDDDVRFQILSPTGVDKIEGNLVVRALQDVNLEDMIKLNAQFSQNVADTNSESEVQLDFSALSSVSEILDIKSFTTDNGWSLKFSETIDGPMQVLDAQGKMVYRQNINSDRFQLAKSQLPAQGVYILNFLHKGEIYAKRIVAL